MCNTNDVQKGHLAIAFPCTYLMCGWVQDQDGHYGLRQWLCGMLRSCCRFSLVVVPQVHPQRPGNAHHHEDEAERSECNCSTPSTQKLLSVVVLEVPTALGTALLQG